MAPPRNRISRTARRVQELSSAVARLRMRRIAPVAGRNKTIAPLFSGAAHRRVRLEKRAQEIAATTPSRYGQGFVDALLPKGGEGNRMAGGQDEKDPCQRQQSSGD